MHQKHGHLVPTPGDWYVSHLTFTTLGICICNLYFECSGDQYQQYELLKEEVGAVG